MQRRKWNEWYWYYHQTGCGDANKWNWDQRIESLQMQMFTVDKFYTGFSNWDTYISVASLWFVWLQWPYLPRSAAVSYHSTRAVRHYESRVCIRNIRLQAPTLARKCSNSHWSPCGADGRAAGPSVKRLPKFLGWITMGLHSWALCAKIKCRL